MIKGETLKLQAQKVENTYKANIKITNKKTEKKTYCFSYITFKVFINSMHTSSSNCSLYQKSSCYNDKN